MTLNEWNAGVKALNEVYGICYGYGDNEMSLPQCHADLEDAWFHCPECGEPIYFCDYAVDLSEYCGCPICDFGFEI